MFLGFATAVIGTAPRAWAEDNAMGGTGDNAADTTPDAARKAAARVKLVDGGKLLKLGEFQQALAAFQEAYALYPSPKIQYDFGLAYQGMGRSADAIDAMNAFLASTTETRQPEVETKARDIREHLLTRVAWLKVTSETAGATIVVDGREMGRTPQTRDIHLDPGPHLLLVDRGDGTPPFTQRLNAAAGATVSVVAQWTGGTSPTAGTAPPTLIVAPVAAGPGTGGAVGPGRRWRVAGIAAASGGAVFLGGGVLFGLAARSASSDVSKRYDASRDSAGKRDQTLQWVGYGVGLTAIAAGVLLFTHGNAIDRNETPPGLHAVVTLGGVFVEGRFQ